MILHITAKAWARQQALLDWFDTEIGWLGLCRRLPPNKNGSEFELYDILVYPQIITGVTVNTDQQAYNDWFMSLPPEVYQNIRYQAHSHVHMTVSPSSTDIANTLRQVDNMGAAQKQNDFFLFLIWNKLGQYSARLFVDGKWYTEDSGELLVQYHEVDPEFASQVESAVRHRTPQDHISFETLDLYSNAETIILTQEESDHESE